MILNILFDAFRYEPEVDEVEFFIEDFLFWLDEEQNYVVSRLEGKITSKNLSGSDLLFIFSPGEELPYSEEEVNALSKWVEDGGVLIITRPVKNFEQLNSLTERFDLKFTQCKAESYAFFTDVTKKFMEKDPVGFVKYQRVLADHPISKGLTAVAEGLPKFRLHPYFIEVSEEWDVIGASAKNNEARPVVAIRKYGKGIVLALGVLYLFYLWRSWLKYEKWEKKKGYVLSNATFMRRVFDFVEKHVKNTSRSS